MSYVAQAGSVGAVETPFFNLVCWYLGKCQFYHITAYYLIPPFFDLTLYWTPEEEDKVQLIFALTFGSPRDLDTGEVVFTDQIGFWHRGRGMKLHWDPLVPSIINTVYPHVTPATKEDPFVIRFVNRTSRAIIIDVSVWVMEYHKRDFEDFLEMVRGFANLFRLLGKAGSPEELAGLIRGLLAR
jgi:hypothetical protein